MMWYATSSVPASMPFEEMEVASHGELYGE